MRASQLPGSQVLKSSCKLVATTIIGASVGRAGWSTIATFLIILIITVVVMSLHFRDDFSLIVSPENSKIT